MAIHNITVRVAADSDMNPRCATKTPKATLQVWVSDGRLVCEAKVLGVHSYGVGRDRDSAVANMLADRFGSTFLAMDASELTEQGYSPAGTLTLYTDGTHSVEWWDECKHGYEFNGERIVCIKCGHWMNQDWRVAVIDPATGGSFRKELLGEWVAESDNKAKYSPSVPNPEVPNVMRMMEDALKTQSCTSCQQPFNAYRKQVPAQTQCADCYLGWRGNGSVMRPLDRRIEECKRGREPEPEPVAWSSPGYGDDPMGGV